MYGLRPKQAQPSKLGRTYTFPSLGVMPIRAVLSQASAREAVPRLDASQAAAMKASRKVAAKAGLMDILAGG